MSNKLAQLSVIAEFLEKCNEIRRSADGHEGHVCILTHVQLSPVVFCIETSFRRHRFWFDLYKLHLTERLLDVLHWRHCMLPWQHCQLITWLLLDCTDTGITHSGNEMYRAIERGLILPFVNLLNWLRWWHLMAGKVRGLRDVRLMPSIFCPEHGDIKFVRSFRIFTRLYGVTS